MWRDHSGEQRHRPGAPGCAARRYPPLPSLRNLLRGDEEHHRTFLSVVESEEQVEALASAAQQVVGDFSQLNTGLLFALPLSHIYGLTKAAPGGQGQAPSHGVHARWR